MDRRLPVDGIDQIIVCPRCQGKLWTAGDDRWSCLGCGSTYAGLRGIPDLRTEDDVFLANRADWEFARRLNEDYDRLDFRGLLERYFELSPEIPTDLRRRQMAHILAGPERFTEHLERNVWLRCLISWDWVLDLGCGTGSVLLALARRPPGLDGWEDERPLCGVDIALRWLLLARKRLDEEGFSHVRLVCGCAERQPFASQSFGGLIGGDVIEHVGDQAATLAEAHRVLKPWGRLFLATPNRFSLAPEPHVQVWGVGFLPRRWMSAYVRWKRKVDFRAIRTLHYGEWVRLLKRSPFGGGDILAPGLSENELAEFPPVKRALGRFYNSCLVTGFGWWLARAFGPLYHIHCHRRDEPAVQDPRSTPSLRRYSRPSTTRV